MASLSNTKIKDTYQSLVKFSDNGNITISAKLLTDGFGNNSPLYVSTTQIGIGITPQSGYGLHVSNNVKIGGELEVSGNLTVNGTLTYLNVVDLEVDDPLIQLAVNNAANILDIGLFGKYVSSGTKYKGLFNDASDDKFKLFTGLTVKPLTTVNTSATGYTVATLVANLEGNVTGNLTGNADTSTKIASITNSNIVQLTTTQTLTNKTLTSPTITGTGAIAGTFTGDLTGNVTGDITGDITGDVTGNLTGDVTGNVTGGLTGNVTGNVTGNLTGNVTGDVTGNAYLNTIAYQGGEGTELDNSAFNVDGIGTNFKWIESNSGTTGSTWKKVADVVLNDTGFKNGVQMEVKVLQPNTYWGDNASLNTIYYSIAFRGDESDTGPFYDDALVYGQDANLIRVYKTSTHNYELQARSNDDNRDLVVECNITSKRSSKVTFTTAYTDGTITGGTAYTASGNALNKTKFAGNVEFEGAIFDSAEVDDLRVNGYLYLGAGADSTYGGYLTNTGATAEGIMVVVDDVDAFTINAVTGNAGEQNTFFKVDDAVKLYDANGVVLETVLGGVDITGTLDVSGGITVDGTGTFNSNVVLAKTNATSYTNINADGGGLYIETAGSTDSLSGMRFQARASGAGNYVQAMILPGIQQFKVRTNSTDAIIVDTNQNLGVNIDPVSKFHIKYSGGNYGGDSTSGFINEATTGRGTQRIRSITDSPAELLFDIDGGVAWDISARDSSSSHDLMFFSRAGTPAYNAVGSIAVKFGQNGDITSLGNGIFSGRLELNDGVTMTGGWRRTALLTSVYPVIVLSSTADGTNYDPSTAGIGYDSSFGTRFWKAGTSTDISGTGSAWMSVPNSGTIEINQATRFSDFIRVDAGTTGNSVGGITWSSTDNGFLYAYAGGVIKAKIDSANDSYLLGGGLGIGTNSITVAGTNFLGLHIKNTLQSSGSSIVLENNAGHKGYLYTGTTTDELAIQAAGALLFNAGATNKGRFNNSGFSFQVGTSTATTATFRLGGDNSAGGRLYFEYSGDTSYIDSFGGHGSTARYRDLAINGRSLTLKTGTTLRNTLELFENGNVKVSDGGMIVNTTQDAQLFLKSTDTWCGIQFNDGNSINENIFYNGINGTFSIGGGGSNVANKKLHIDGGVTIGSSYDQTAVDANSLNIEGTITSGGGFTSCGSIKAAGELVLKSSDCSYDRAYWSYDDNANQTYLWNIESDAFTSFYTNNLERLRIKADGVSEFYGSVGIGTTPNTSYSKLQVKTPASAYGFDLIGRDAGSNSESQITFWNSTQTSVLASIYNSSSNLYFYTNGDNRMIINSNGYIGIGGAPVNQRRLSIYNTNGDNELEFIGSEYTNLYSQTESTFNIKCVGSGGEIKLGTLGGDITINSSNDAIFTGLDVGINLTSLTAGGFTPKFALKQSSNSEWGGINIESQADDSVLALGSAAGRHTINTSYRSSAGYKPLDIKVAGNLGVTIATNGHVGINNASPSSRLHLKYSGGSYGTDATSGFINQADTGRSTTRLRSIGNEASELFFDVNGAIRWDLSARPSSQGYDLNFYPQAASPSLGGVSAHTLALKQDGRVYFKYRAGFNTESPDAYVHVYQGSGGSNGTDGIRVNGLNNYPSLGLGISGNYHGMIRTYGNDLEMYAGHWRTIGNTSSENHSIRFYTSKSGSSNWSTAKMTLDHYGMLEVNGATIQTGGWGEVIRAKATYPGYTFNSNNSKWAGIFYDYSWGMRFYINSSSSNVTSGTPMVNIKNTGNIRIGDGNDPSYKLDVAGTIRATSDVIAFSDRRVKENIITIDNALDKVTKLRGVTYTRKDIEDKSTKVGVIAQEVLDVLPEVVSQDDEGKYSVAYGNLAGVFIEAIKELKAEIDSLKEEIKQLKK